MVCFPSCHQPKQHAFEPKLLCSAQCKAKTQTAMMIGVLMRCVVKWDQIWTSCMIMKKTASPWTVESRTVYFSKNLLLKMKFWNKRRCGTVQGWDSHLLFGGLGACSRIRVSNRAPLTSKTLSQQLDPVSWLQAAVVDWIGFRIFCLRLDH